MAITALKSFSSIVLIAASAATFMMSSSPVFAFTCEDVRNLSVAEQAYWSKRLNLSVAERNQIRRVCSTVQSPSPRAIPVVSAVSIASE